MKKLSKLLKTAALLLCTPLIAGTFSAPAHFLSVSELTADAAKDKKEQATEEYTVTFKGVTMWGAFCETSDNEFVLSSLTISLGSDYGKNYGRSLMLEFDPTSFSDSKERLSNVTKLVRENTDSSFGGGKLLNITVKVKEDPGVTVYDPDKSNEIKTLTDIISISDYALHYFGDVNDNGNIDSFDLILLRQLLTDNSKTELTDDQFKNADINKNGSLDEDDLQQLSDYLLGAAEGFNLPSPIGSVRLDNTVSVEAEKGVEADEKFASSQMKLGINMLKKLNVGKEKKDNMLISPFSAAAALTMTANGADSETLKEMEEVLGNGLSIDELNNYMVWYINNLPDSEKEKILVADSIWFKDKPTLQVYDSFLETNMKYFNAEIYKTAFDRETVKDINSWVKTNTQGMIPKLLEEDAFDMDDGKDEKLMALINTVFFEAQWKNKYYESTKTTFTNKKGEKKEVEGLYSNADGYYDLGNAVAFKKPYAGRYQFVGILPNDDIDIDDYIAELDPEKVSNGLKKMALMKDGYIVSTMIPEFEYTYDCSLVSTLAELGMPTAFTYSADFSRINDITIPNADRLYISEVLQKTNIKLTKEGTNAAAATAVIMSKANSIEMPRPTINIYLNRPFVYMIVDENDTPIFIGTVTDIGK